jgi:hypothetical protein
VLELPVLGWKEVAELAFSKFSFCLLPELALFLIAILLLKLSFVSSNPYLTFSLFLSGDRQANNCALDFFFMNRDSSFALSFFLFSIIENSIINIERSKTQVISA